MHSPSFPYSSYSEFRLNNDPARALEDRYRRCCMIAHVLY